MKSLKAVSDLPMAWGRRVRKLCRAAAEAGSPGGGIPPEDEAWFLRGPESGLCSLAGPPGVPVGCSGTASLGGSPLSQEVEVVEDSWAGCPVREAYWGAGVHWGLVGRGDTEEAAWSDGQSHRDLRKKKERERLGKKRVGEQSQIESAEGGQ